MGEEQRVSWQELLQTSHDAFETGTDLTVAVEEEFALVDPDTKKPFELDGNGKDRWTGRPESRHH